MPEKGENVIGTLDVKDFKTKRKFSPNRIQMLERK